ncbi:16S rRNA (uracil(1498)-N(3))-methyltransferase [Brevundimonas sp.]|uniref:16S rRNA (uracil(1498)-N(3))-methyltransferase n=1 Tax=Brevundimonas sp. TaxID=1871086 RepID=UPI002AB7FECA|nr:16S rRNA (uracil(1498)-N(3))-methyltransferase [Brevundimonas sp.]MDZ4364911.1 16S rRNA (uracil(1498)-N(3))-methyltransferase [Brevundimonas sp.]
MIRLHLPQPLSAGAALAPTLDQSRYLTQVMRLKLGDALVVFNGQDGEWRCDLTDILKKGVVLTAQEQVRPQAMGPDVQLLMAVVKKSAMEFAVEKATELGVRHIRPILTARTQGHHLRLDRLDAIAIESAEQTGRMDLPAIDDPVRLADVLDGWDPGRRLMFCDETGGGAPVLTALSHSPSPSWGGTASHEASQGGAAPDIPTPIAAAIAPPHEGEGERPAGPWAILIGPEGGFSPQERDRLRALPYATAVSLGPRVLRADTAAIAALTLWQTAVGDWER